MKKIQNTIILLFLVQISFGQNPKTINNQAIQFSLKQKNDTIDFIVVDTKTDVKKPIFLFCQGSLPLPLFVKPEKEEMWMIGGGTRSSKSTKHCRPGYANVSDFAFF